MTPQVLTTPTVPDPASASMASAPRPGATEPIRSARCEKCPLCGTWRNHANAACPQAPKPCSYRPPFTNLTDEQMIAMKAQAKARRDRAAAAEALDRHNQAAAAAALPPQDPKPCSSGCGRLASEGYKACCRTCTYSSGSSHGPICEAAAASRPGAGGNGASSAGHC